MRYFIDGLVKPFLESNGYTRLCEIGAHKGVATEKLLGASGASICTIDPCADEDLKGKFGGTSRVDVRKGFSLDVLPELQGQYDCFLIDGDHNWYTVFHELQLIESRRLLKRGGAIVLHDVRWPYARRDMYYQPELIPESYRQPYATRGIHQGQSELSDASPHFSNLNNAVREGGPRNGVLTAIEDFRRQSNERYFFLTCNVEYGLGVLVHKDGNRGPFDVLKWRLRFLRFETAARLSRLRWRIEEAIERALPGPYRWLTSVKRLVPPGRTTR